MNALELAMKMEQDGESLYLDLAARATQPGFKEIFTQLAQDERKHYQIFETMQHHQEEFKETPVLKTADNIFKRMIAEDKLDDLDDSQLILYQKAMELERQSQHFYLKKADETQDSREKDLFRKIAAEEEKHYFLLHNIYELVLRPQTWVENGEFVHLEDY